MDNTNLDSDNFKNIQFIQHYLSHLEPGDYQICVTQQVTATQPSISESFSTAPFDFTVRGPRFSLNPDEFYSLFPPVNSQGEFNNCLPHLVLTRRSLPWERALENTQESFLEVDADQAPWLALFVFDQNDPSYTQTSTTLQNLITPPAATFFPKTELEKEQSATDSCNIIDIPADLFNSIAPTALDLPFLAHARKLSVDQKATRSFLKSKALLNDDDSTHVFSVIVANRLPQAGHRTTVHLVSLENFGPYLPSNTGSSNLPSNINTVRLVSLKSWSFASLAEKETFSEYLTELNCNPSVLQLPNTISNPQSDADKAVVNSFNMGYVPLNHYLRQSSQTVSWFRGPLVPFNIPVTLTPPFSNADALTAYDPNTGMLDISYSSAWQLGQLLSLHNQEIAQAIYSWRLSNMQQAITNMELELIEESLNLEKEENTSLQTRLLSGPIKSALQAFIALQTKDET